MTNPGFDLTTIDPRQIFARADAIASTRTDEMVDVAPQFIVTMYDNHYRVLGEISDYISCTATFELNGVGTATILMKGDDPLAEAAMACAQTVVGITIQVNDLRWSGRVDTAGDDRVDGVDTVTLQCLSDWNWFNKLLVWPAWWAPIELQYPKEAVYIGPACSVLATMATECTIRLQAGLWEFFNNILDPPAWFATAMMGQGIRTPIAVVPVDTLHDQSKWVAVTSKMATVATLAGQICKDNGVALTADLWLPGEPQPTTAYTLTVPTIVVRVTDRSGITGPTGTFVDGLISTVIDIAEGAFGESVAPFTNSEFTPPGVDLAAQFGFHWERPWAIYTDHPRGGVKEFHTTAHHPLAYTVVSGGRSPQWVNKLIDLVLEFALSEILTAIGLAGISSTLLDGIFDNVVLAYQEIENAPRRFALGPYGYPEIFVAAGSTAYTLSEFFALFNGMWDSRGYYSWELVTFDGQPYAFGKDIQIGDLASWVRRGKMYTDYLMKATVVDDRSKRVEFIAHIGDNKSRESPWARLQRQITGFEAAMQVALLSQN